MRCHPCQHTVLCVCRCTPLPTHSLFVSVLFQDSGGFWILDRNEPILFHLPSLSSVIIVAAKVIIFCRAKFLHAYTRSVMIFSFYNRSISERERMAAAKSRHYVGKNVLFKVLLLRTPSSPIMSFSIIIIYLSPLPCIFCSIRHE